MSLFMCSYSGRFYSELALHIYETIKFIVNYHYFILAMKLNTQSKRANYVCYVFRSTEILKFVTSLVQFATDHTTAAV